MAVDFSNFDFSSIGVKGTGENTSTKKKELGQEDFLRLMIEQFRHQDPMKPMENGEFLGQLAQFSSVAGLTELKDSFASLSSSLTANQTLQASSLLGRDVLVAGNKAKLGADGGVAGSMELYNSTSSAVVQVKDASGAVVRKIFMGPQSAGLTRFTWDGTTDGGARAPTGTYTFEAHSLNSDGTTVAGGMFIANTVESVTLGGQGGITLSVRGLGEISIDRVRQIS